MTRQEILLTHIRGSGPVSFRSCVDYADKHHPGIVLDYGIAADLTALIKEGLIELGEDGESFDTTAETEALVACIEARQLVGRRWKDIVSTCWMDGNYHRHALRDLSGPLQRARNQLGPEWLAKVKLPKLLKPEPVS